MTTAALSFSPSDVRPCPAPLPADFLFERRLNDYIFNVVADFSAGRPSLIFCNSRKGASDTAVHLAREAGKHQQQQQAPGRRAGGGASAYVRDAAHRQRLAAAAGGLQNPALRDCIQMGCAWHHAGMEPAERELVERLFVAQDLAVGGAKGRVGAMLRLALNSV